MMGSGVLIRIRDQSYLSAMGGYSKEGDGLQTRIGLLLGTKPTGRYNPQLLGL